SGQDFGWQYSVIVAPRGSSAPAAGDWAHTIPCGTDCACGAACACSVTVNPSAASMSVAWTLVSPMTLGTTTAFGVLVTGVTVPVGVGTAVGAEAGVVGTGVAGGDGVTGVEAPGVVRGACGVTDDELVPTGVTGAPEFPDNCVATAPAVTPMTATAAAA